MPADRPTDILTLCIS